MISFLYENQFIPNEHHRLIDYIKHNEAIQKFFTVEFQKIKSNNYCGFLQIQNENYFIIPKIADSETENLNIFIYMLLYAYDIKTSNEEIATFDNAKFKIMEIFIRFFADKLIEELKRGVYKNYISNEENLKVLRGKYLIEKNFSNFYHQNIYCEFDEFSQNNELNRFFLFAIKTFQRYSNYQNLHLCEMMFDEVALHHIDINRITIHFDKLNERFKRTFEMALMILKMLSPLVDSNDNKSFAFLFDMAEVFEKFIGNIYKTIDNSAKLQYQKNFGNLQLKPDIVTNNMIIDTKYKIVSNKDDLATNDKYQMFAYGINFGIKNTMLLYPKHFQKDFKDEDLKLGTGDNEVSLKMRSIDLKCDENYEKFIKEIRVKLKKIGQSDGL